MKSFEPRLFYRLKDSTALQYCIDRAINYAPYCDLIWMETSHPTIADAREFAEGVRKVYPDKMFAYNCSPSFNWKQHLSPTQLEKFQKELGALGFKYQFITLAGFHANSYSMFDLARNYKEKGMLAYSSLQQQEFAAEQHGYSAVKHQREVGTGYFDHISNAVTGGQSSTTALTGSTEEAQFHTATASSEDEEILMVSEINDGVYFPDFSSETAHLREDLGWKGSEIPHDLQVFMADFEDSNTPSWRNQVEGQVNLYDAVRDNISYIQPATKKEYTLNQKVAVLNVRPRGWHLPEKHVLIHNKPTSGSLFDFGLFVYHNAKVLKDKGSGPYFYLPKLQNAEEAKLWAEVFAYSEDRLGLPKGTIKCTVLIEHLLATFQMNEIIYALKDHIVGLNCGRWDYIFSYIKTFQNHRKFLLPDRFQIGGHDFTIHASILASCTNRALSLRNSPAPGNAAKSYQNDDCHGAYLSQKIGARTINTFLFRILLTELLPKAINEVSRLPEAAELLEKFALEEHMSDFLTLDAYDKLVSEGH
ncbi:putative malate synthase A [Ostertagia ostertagi]